MFPLGNLPVLPLVKSPAKLFVPLSVLLSVPPLVPLSVPPLVLLSVPPPVSPPPVDLLEFSFANPPRKRKAVCRLPEPPLSLD